MRFISKAALVVGAALIAMPAALAQESEGWSWLVKEMATDVGKCTAAKRAPDLLNRVPGIPGGFNAPDIQPVRGSAFTAYLTRTCPHGGNWF